tara:strand:- start:370 stop:525 length:156 start_codon:yes stop_codon:yes gene_type:complete
MWVFYHEVTKASGVAASHVISDGLIFFIMGVVTATIILAPSFFENRKNKDR